MRRTIGNALESTTLKCARIAVDIGSTVVKIARLDSNGEVESQQLVPRDFEAGIARQVESLLERCDAVLEAEEVLVCSSANGGLQVGIGCLSKRFSGAVMRNQVLLAGANPVFVHDFDEEGGSLTHVDILLVGGGVNCEDSIHLERRLRRFDPKRYQFGSLVYAGNSHLASLFAELFSNAAIVSNPLADELGGRSLSVFEAVRRAFLDDLVYKEGVSELKGSLSTGIHPTPEIVSRGFQRALANSSAIKLSGPCVVLDIGGATTDLHYTVEVVRDDSEERPSPGVSAARFVFTDLGIAASRQRLVLQLRSYPRLYEFLTCVLDDNIQDVYQTLREGEWEPPPLLLSYACLFIALDRFAHGKGPGLPTADLARIEQVLLTGGASQAMREEVIARVLGLFRSENNGVPAIFIDRRYQLWVDGITWSGQASM